MFHYYRPTEIHFGVGQLNELEHIYRGYGGTCFLVTAPDAPLQPLYEHAERLLDVEGISVAHFNKAELDPSVEIVKQEFTMLKKQPADFILAVGDGSSIDAAKTITFANGRESIDWDHLFSEYGSPFVYYPSYSEKHLPLLSIPTISGTGSQVTQATVVTRGEEKITFFHPDNFSQETILDPQLMLTLPKRMSVATGLNAFTHAFESCINTNVSPYSTMDSMGTMRLVIDHLPHALGDPQNLELRTNVYLADTLAGRTLTNSGVSAPHPLSEIIDGVVHLPRGEALTAAFPAFIQHVAGKNKERFADVAELFGSDDLCTAMIEFLETIGLHKRLEDFGVNEEGFQEILTSPVLDHLPFGNRGELEAILRDFYAWDSPHRS